MEPARILLAEDANNLPTLTAALRGYELLATVTLKQAERLIIEDGINIIVVGIHFEDSRAMELIQMVRLDAKHEKTPIIVHRLNPSDHGAVLRQTLDVMKTLKVIQEYLELEGNPAAKQKIREAVEQYLPAEKFVGIK